jgi:hypothetical protein
MSFLQEEEGMTSSDTLRFLPLDNIPDTAKMAKPIFNSKYNGMMDLKPSKIVESWRDAILCSSTVM